MNTISPCNMSCLIVKVAVELVLAELPAYLASPVPTTPRRCMQRTPMEDNTASDSPPFFVGPLGPREGRRQDTKECARAVPEQPLAGPDPQRQFPVYPGQAFPNWEKLDPSPLRRLRTS